MRPVAFITQQTASPSARLRGADPAAVKWLPGFWAQRFQQCHQVTLPHLWGLMDDPARGHALTNLRIAAGDVPIGSELPAAAAGEFAGTHWQDEWVYKWIEAASYVYGQTGDSQLEARMDEAIDVIARAQAPDGYIATQTQLRGWPRYEKYQHHEVYVMGHLLSAACAHYRATGKSTFLQVACKVGDYLYTTFKPPRPAALEHKIFNPSQIMGLAELYRATGEPRYLEAVGFFVDYHGSTPGGIDQMQDRVPLRAERQVVGHMVLATYLYAGATDAYLETGDETLLHAVERLWQDLVEKRLYVHGGVCAVHRGHSVRAREVIAGSSGAGDPAAAALAAAVAAGSTFTARPLQPDAYPGHLVSRHVDDVHEAAGDDFELPNSTGYNETCAQIGNVLWNWRLLAASAEARYAELIEHTLYNSVLSGIGQDGASWFYTNPLRFYGRAHKLLSQDAYERFQPGRVHVCCPSNLVRTIAGVHGYVYGTSEASLWVHLYGASAFDGQLAAGARFAVTQQTDYPWDGRVRFTVDAAPDAAVCLMLRIPSWARGATLTTVAVDGDRVTATAEPESYARVERRWSAGDVVELDLPMRSRLIEGHPKIEAVRNQVAVMRGPLLYCLESHDLPAVPAGVSVLDVFLPPDIELRARHLPDLLGGVTVLEGEAEAIREPPWTGTLYRELERATSEPLPVKLIPYYAWANRGTSEMTVWLPLSSRRT